MKTEILKQDNLKIEEINIDDLLGEELPLLEFDEEMEKLLQEISNNIDNIILDESTIALIDDICSDDEALIDVQSLLL